MNRDAQKVLSHRNTQCLIKDSFMLSGRPPAGEVGIEIEVEFSNTLPIPDLPFYWRREFDGSLRGSAAEYILKRPIKRGTVLKALNHLEEGLPPFLIRESNRTSVHVHINMTRATVLQVFNTISLYGIFENVLVKWCGRDRVGNHFCLRMTDAGGLTRVLEDAAYQGSLVHAAREDVRYAALNIAALQRFGSLEFRALRGTTSPDVIHTWVKALLAIKDYVKDTKTPMDLFLEYSTLGATRMTEAVFGLDFAKTLLAPPNALQEIQDGMWEAQAIAGAYEAGQNAYEEFKFKGVYESSIPNSDVETPTSMGETSSSGEFRGFNTRTTSMDTMSALLDIRTVERNDDYDEDEE